MSQRNFENNFLNEVIEEVRELGFKVRRNPRLWGSSFRPDLLLDDTRGRRIAIEIKTRPISPSEILKLKRLPVDKVIICAPKNVLNNTASSVSDYASQSKVVLCGLNEIGFILSGL